VKRLYRIALLVVPLGLAPSITWAADARDYIPAPPGTTLAIMYFQHTTGHELYSDGDKLSNGLNLSANVGIFRPVYYTKLGPFVVDPQALIPFADQHVDGSAVGDANFSGSGLADPVLLATVWFLNDTASKTWFGFTPYVWLPIGQYDKDNQPFGNIGENRWKGRAEFGFVKGFGDKTYLDLVAYYQVFGDNEDYGNDTLKQEGVVGFETHLSFDVTKTFFVSAD